MDQCEDREEGAPPSKTTLCGEHESQTKAQRNPHGPPPSSVSLQSDKVKKMIDKSEQRQSSEKRIRQSLKCGPPLSSVSLKSDWSADRPINFEVRPLSAAERKEQHESQTKANRKKHRRRRNCKPEPETESGPQPSSVSLQTDTSKDNTIITFKVQPLSAAERVEPAGVQWLRPGLRKYSCQLTIDTNTVNTNLQLSDNNRKVTRVEEVQSYPDHPDRFDVKPQLLCRNGLTGRCYWEVEWRGRVDISVSYRRIRRKGNSYDCVFGRNDHSWNLICADDGPDYVRHNYRETSISSSSSGSNRVAVYVDCPAGTLSFYRVSSDTLIHLHTFNTTFTETLYPGFRFDFGSPGSSVSLC